MIISQSKLDFSPVDGLLVPVTQAHIDESKEPLIMACPMRLATTDAIDRIKGRLSFPIDSVEVDGFYINLYVVYVDGKRVDEGINAHLSHALHQWTADYDKGKPVKPITLKIYKAVTDDGEVWRAE